jgi:hypothetical protein
LEVVVPTATRRDLPQGVSVSELTLLLLRQRQVVEAASPSVLHNPHRHRQPVEEDSVSGAQLRLPIRLQQHRQLLQEEDSVSVDPLLFQLRQLEALEPLLLLEALEPLQLRQLEALEPLLLQLR